MELYWQFITLCKFKEDLYSFSKNVIISSVRKHYCALGLVLGLRLELRLAKVRFGQTCLRARVVKPQFGFKF